MVSATVGHVFPFFGGGGLYCRWFKERRYTSSSWKMVADKKISVVIPVYGSQDCVGPLVESVTASLAGAAFELILVNDGSLDDSWAEIKKSQAANAHVIAINLRRNSGQDNAIMAGFSQVTGDYVVVMDDDLQHDPREIRALIAELVRSDADVCFAKFRSKRQRLWKNLGSWFNGKMAEVIINKPKDIYLSPYKVIRRDVVNEIIRYRGPYPYVDGLIFTITQSIAQVTVEHRTRYAGESNYTLWRSVSIWLKLMTSFSVFPLRLAMFAGMIASLGGFVLAILFVVRYFTVHEPVEGWTSLMVVVLILCGTILMALGGVGEYVGRSYIQLNRRPQYSIKEMRK